MKSVNHTLIVGYGSIGRRHARSFAELGSDLTILDSNPAARTQAAQDFPQAQIVADMAGLSLPRDSAAVIATWGPSHASIFNALAERGVGRILCEKPLATSVADASAMVQRAQQEGIVLGVNHYLRYAGIVSALRELLQSYELGDPVAVRIEGGAACLVTNGIHWIDFACELFGAEPEEVLSTARGAAINPRSPELSIYQGTAVWRFSGDREAVVSFSNLSSLSLTARVFLRDAVVELNGDGEVVLRQRDMEAVQRFPAITRTGPANEVLFSGQLPHTLPFEAHMLVAAREVLQGLPPTVPGSVGAVAVGSIIGALLSAREQTPIKLPLAATSSWGQESWNIS